MEAATLVSKAMLASSELTEVARGLGDDIVVELEDDATSRLVVDRNVELYGADEVR